MMSNAVLSLLSHPGSLGTSSPPAAAAAAAAAAVCCRTETMDCEREADGEEAPAGLGAESIIDVVVLLPGFKRHYLLLYLTSRCNADQALQKKKILRIFTCAKMQQCNVCREPGLPDLRLFGSMPIHKVTRSVVLGLYHLSVRVTWGNQSGSVHFSPKNTDCAKFLLLLLHAFPNPLSDFFFLPPFSFCLW